MKYVQSNLMPNEQIIAIGAVHWWVYVPGTVLALFGLIVIASTGAFGWISLLIGLFLLGKAYIYSISTELAITDKRVIAKFGFIGRRTIELLHKNVESLQVDQSIFGRMLNFGTVFVNGTGSGRTPIGNISAPLEFRRKALSVIESVAVR
jgi:uncharacterized membrane protein YdbT with pleckstrin-like domain